MPFIIFMYTNSAVWAKDCGCLEEKSHATTLTVVEQIEFVNQLVDVICSFCERTQVHDESNVIRLSVKFLLKLKILNDW